MAATKFVILPDGVFFTVAIEVLTLKKHGVDSDVFNKLNQLFA